ncbi:MAG: ATP-binding cassette domain-containing protein [Burkholderiaceae bacterium]|nr:ATP-binding cassette domain-containing protein [Burkholderiaceae bacterium]
MKTDMNLQASTFAALGSAEPTAARSIVARLRRASRNGLVWPPLLVLVAILVVPQLSSGAQLKWTLWLSFGIVALSLDLVWGKAGIFSFGQNALFGIGAYAYAVAAINWFPITFETGSALIVAALVAALFAAVLGYVMFYGRVGDVYLAIVTLAVTLVLYTVMQSTAGPEYRIGEALLGGFNGMPSVPSIALGVPFAEDNAEMGTESLLVFAICLAGLLYIGTRALVSSRFGQILGGLRENESRMELLGYDVRRYKLAVFVLGGAIAGLGGALFAAWGMFVNPVVFSLNQAALVVIWVMVGGRGTLAGAFLGVVIVQWISDSANLIVEQQTPLILGMLLVAVVLVFPNGLAPGISRVARLLRRYVPGRSGVDNAPEPLLRESSAADPECARSASARAGHLAAFDVKKQFGGLRVLEGVSLAFDGPGIHAIIGPNGAGKSTFFGVLTGRHDIREGRVELDGRIVTELPTFERARRGLGIKLQVPSVFQGLTVRENLALAAGSRASHGISRHAAQVLDAMGLTRKADAPVSTLSHGEQQWLEICMVLLQNPSVILLDEPAAGMTQDERVQTVKLIRQLGVDHTVVVVEHDMGFIRALDAPVAMLDRGKVFRVGSFDEISRDPEVISIYLGRRDVARR